jgi:hypothetical protein
MRGEIEGGINLIFKTKLLSLPTYYFLTNFEDANRSDITFRR